MPQATDRQNIGQQSDVQTVLGAQKNLDYYTQ
jgi:hypothetical protein